MSDVIAERAELLQMREQTREAVNSLELCWSCRRICSCEHWIVAEGVSIWLCGECLADIAAKAEAQADSSRPETYFGFRKDSQEAAE